METCDTVTGLGSAFCDLCFLSKEEAHNQSMVPSMKVERTYVIRFLFPGKDEGSISLSLLEETIHRYISQYNITMRNVHDDRPSTPEHGIGKDEGAGTH